MLALFKEIKCMIENLQEEKTIERDPSWFAIPFSQERNQRSWEKWLFLGLGPEKHKMSLEHLQ